MPASRTPSTTNPAPRFHFIDGLRGFAAMWVVLFHAKVHLATLMAALPDPVSYAIFMAGHNGVAVFFVLSGFVIAHSVRSAPKTLRFLGQFALRRSIRLDPPYWASMIVVGIFALISGIVTHKEVQFPGLSSIFAHMIYMQEFLQITEINTVYWALTYEIQFYIVFILCRNASSRIGWGVWIPMLVIAVIWGSGLLHANLLPGLFVDKWYAFFLGVLAYHARADHGLRSVLLVLVATCVLGSVASSEAFPITCAATAVILCIVMAKEKMSAWLNWRWLQFLGLISYSLYLTHNPVTGASSYVWKAVFGSGGVSELFGLFFLLSVCVLFAAGFWWTFERVAIKFANAVLKRPSDRSEVKDTIGRPSVWIQS